MQKVKIIEGGVCAAKGFRAAGVGAEIKYKGRNDVALIVCRGCGLHDQPGRCGAGRL